MLINNMALHIDVVTIKIENFKVNVIKYMKLSNKYNFI